jgi:WD40 repeat protein
VGEIFISHASADTNMAKHVADGVRQAGHSIFLDSDLKDGIVPAADWQQTMLHELRICDAVVFLNSGAGQASKWCHSELVIAIDLRKRVYPLDLGPDLQRHPLLESLQGITFDSTIDASIRRLTDSLDITKPRFEHGRCPYPGLAAMEVADAGVFFGRDDEVGHLADRIDGQVGQRDGDLVVVMGPSGAGKSSLVCAGLAGSRLAKPHSGWALAGPFEPGLLPLDRLLGQLVALLPGRLTEDECRDRLLSQGMAAFGEWLADHTETPAKRLLITLDQAEQLATVTKPREGEKFLNVLGGGLGPGSPVTVVMTVRSDRFDEIQQLPVIGPATRKPSVIVPIAPIGRDQLPMVIEKPASLADLTFEPGLVSRLIDDVMRGSSGETTDALPFLAFVLREMYDRVTKQDRTIFTIDDYERVGRIDGAIKQRTQDAERELARHQPDSGPLLEHLLPRFVALSEERLPAARPVPCEQLSTAEQPIVEKLEDQRLLVRTGETVRLAHERLITAWPRLARAVDDRRDDLLLQARLERQAADWKGGHGELLGRDGTTAARSWLARQAGPGTNHTAIGEYVRASQAALRRRRAQVVSVIAALAVLTLLAAGTAGYAVYSNSQAVTERNQAIFNQVTAEAAQASSTDPSLAAELNALAYQMKPTNATYTKLISDENTPLSTVLPVRPGSADSVAFSPDGRLLAGGTGSGVELWSVSDPSHPRLLSTPPAVQAGAVSSVAFSPDGRLLASAAGAEIQLWNISDPSRPRLLDTPLGPLPNQHGQVSLILSVAFSPDGSTVAAGAADEDVHLWRVTNPSQPVSLGWLTNDTDSVTSVAFSPNGDFLATGSADDTATVWSIADPASALLAYPTLSGHTGAIRAVAISPDGHTLVTASADGTIRLWNLPSTVLAGHSGYVDALAFSRTRGILASGSADDTLRLWDVSKPSAPRPLTGAILGPAQYNALSFSPDGLVLAAASSDVVQLWQTANPRHPTLMGPPLTGFSAYVATVAFSPDGRVLAAGSFDGTMGLWDVANPAHPTALGPPLRLSTSGVQSVAFSPDGQVLAAGGLDGVIRLWDVANPAHPTLFGRPLASDAGGVYSVAFSPDGRTLATGNRNGTVQLWNVSDPAHASALGPPLTGHTDEVDSVAFSPDGRTLATGSFDETIRLWNVADPARAQAIGGPVTGDPNYINAVVFGVGDNILIGADGDYTIRIWNLDAAAAIQHICATTVNVLTSAQWEKYVPELPYHPPCGASQ